MENDKITYLIRYQNKFKEFEQSFEALKFASKQEQKGLIVKMYRCSQPIDSLFDFMHCVYYTNMGV